MWESQLQTLRWGFKMLSDGCLACTKRCQPFQGPSDYPCFIYGLTSNPKICHCNGTKENHHSNPAFFIWALFTALIPFYCLIVIILKIFDSVIPKPIINQQGFWRLLIWGQRPPIHQRFKSELGRPLENLLQHAARTRSHSQKREQNQLAAPGTEREGACSK